MTQPRITSNDPLNRSDLYDSTSLEAPSNQTEQLISNVENANIGRVNWLGSSYTGADIKMVAHLYTTPQASTEEADIRTEIQELQSASTAAIQASEAILTVGLGQNSDFYGQDSAVNIANLGGVMADSSAGQFLISIFRSIPQGGSWEITKSSISRAFLAQGNTMAITKDALQAKLNNLAAVREKSTQTVVLANLQTLSVQTFRQKQAVRALGKNYPVGYTRSNRTIGGSMIFTMFNEHSLAQLIRSMSATGSIYGELDNELSTYIADQLPPFDVTIAFANEYGSISQMNIYGIEFMSDGITLSVEDLLTEQVLQFVARDIDVMTSRGNIPLSLAQRGMNSAGDNIRDRSASRLIFSSKEAYADYLTRLGLRRRRTQY